MSKVFIGIDNGVTGSIGIITDESSEFFMVPTFSQQSYTKAKANITRIDHEALFNKLSQYKDSQIYVMLERPMVNPTRFKATVSAIRALEAVLTVLERVSCSLTYIDSREWQSKILPLGSRGTPELKKDSLDIGMRLFPMHAALFRKHKDADGMLIAEHCRRSFK